MCKLGRYALLTVGDDQLGRLSKPWGPLRAQLLVAYPFGKISQVDELLARMNELMAMVGGSIGLLLLTWLFFKTLGSGS